ncbi:COX15/CtaA family protein [Alphaproteobacteria bacterium KMM 3653]|uniref:Heme A synthase n=1 Tax=Harenicola maris TaxID=2841044 RepID=A0AAP2CNL6_9RHOB|nr:COX15/CtaA family protein [Harenicola maris]
MAQKRSIFEDVTGETTTPQAPTPGLIDRAAKTAPRAMRLWLVLLFALVAVMILVGGLTRLTDSGLSITEWNVIKGAVPPMNEAAWLVEFEKYKTIPEYELQNKGMALSEFKQIYWWEWGHRQLGRVIGLVWALGFFAFLIARRIPTGWTGKLLLLGVLGGVQGAIGWWMVSSGLTGTMLDVASYRLALHLGIAFLILGFLTWFIMELTRGSRDLLQARRMRERKLFSMSTGLLHVTGIQILLGALVAGIDAGRTYSDWPLMAGGFFPPDPFSITPIWRNFFEDAGLVQFIHRIWAYLLLAFGIVVWARGRRSAHGRTRRAFHAVLAMLLAQAVIGIATVMMAAPWHIAIIHQGGAILLWVLILRARFLAGYPMAASVREGTK